MVRSKVIKEWLPIAGIPYHQAARLLKLSKASENAQTEWHNKGDKLEAAAEKACNAFETYAGKLGFEVMWPGLFPVLQRDGQDIYLPEYDEERTELFPSCTKKSFCFSIMNLLGPSYHHKMGSNGVWFHGDTIDTDSESYDDRFDHKKEIVTEIIDNFLQYIPGLEDCTYYAEFTIEIDMDELEEGGWDELMLKVYIESIISWMEEGKPLRADGGPWRSESTNGYGSKIYVYRFPDFVVPEHPDLEGWDFECQQSRVKTGNIVPSAAYELPPEVSYHTDE